MRLHNMFKKTGEKITSIHSRNRRKPEAPEGILKKCNKCGAAILTDEEATICNVPEISDIDSLEEILKFLNIDIKRATETIIYRLQELETMI